MKKYVQQFLMEKKTTEVFKLFQERELIKEQVQVKSTEENLFKILNMI